MAASGCLLTRGARMLSSQQARLWRRGAVPQARSGSAGRLNPSASSRTVSSTSAGEAGRQLSTVPSSSDSRTWQIRMLYDGDCPLCMREVEMLQRRDAGKGAIDFVDIASPGYSADDNFGVTYEQAMRRIHALLPDGTVVTDVEVFRRLYEAVGLGWIYSVTKNKAVEAFANKVYKVWADNRTTLTGRSDLETILQEKKSCTDDCELPTPK